MTAPVSTKRRPGATRRTQAAAAPVQRRTARPRHLVPAGYGVGCMSAAQLYASKRLGQPRGRIPVDGRKPATDRATTARMGAEA
jgi:hypothetical protein